MTGKLKIHVKKGEFWLVYTIIALTSIVWFVTGMMYTSAFEPGMIPWILAGCVVVFRAMLILMLYMWVKKVNVRRASDDELSDICSFKATRNAFIVTLLMLALSMIIAQINQGSLYRPEALQGIFGVSVASYTASYYYYRYFG
jgi:hypothetical protein